MRGIWSGPLGSEKGQVLLPVLLTILFAAITLSASLGYAFTALKLGQAVEAQLDRFYAADAGIEWGLWEITKADPTLEGWADTGGNFVPLAERINNCDVEVSLSWDDVDTYTITSIATDNETGLETTFEKYFIKVL